MSGFQVNFGRDANGNIIYRTVPCTYGDPSRQVAQILRANSANTTLTVPQISCYISGLKYMRDRVQEPNYVKKVSVIERYKSPVTGQYTNLPGNKFTVERLMPVPYDLTVKADIWTSSTDQKLQLMEQLTVLFNPSMELQSSVNYLDWSSLSLIELTDTTWSSRQVPVGTEDAIDVATLTFNMPIWFSAPAKVKKLGVITNIIVDIFDATGGLRQDLVDQGFTAQDFLLDGELAGSGTTMDAFASPISTDGSWTHQAVKRTSATTSEIADVLLERPLGLRVSFPYSVIVINGVASLIDQRQSISDSGPDGTLTPAGGKYVPWEAVLAELSGFQDGVSHLYLRQTNDYEVVGAVSMNPSNPAQLLFAVDVDTTPSNTLPPVNRIVDPQTQAPGHGLPGVSIGQRYLLLNDTGSLNGTLPSAWAGLVALQYDIIQWNGEVWQISFRAIGTDDPQYITNTANGQQFKWTGVEWLRAWEGLYREGEWRLD